MINTGIARYGCVALLTLGIGCAATAPDETSGNAALEIDHFDRVETASKTTVRGLDADGREVGRLELVHGRFTLSPLFAADYDKPVVDGRKLDVVVREQRASFETEGYEPLMHMPPHLPSQWMLAAFLDDPHVRVVLDEWQLGYEPFLSGGNESAYTVVNGGFYGNDPSGADLEQCSGQPTCGTNQGKTIGTCGGSGYQALYAWRATQDNIGPDTGGYRIAQCCPPTPTVQIPANSGIYPPWFAIKTCPFNGNVSLCGTKSSTTACKSCTAYPVAAYTCTVSANTDPDHVTYSYNTTGPGIGGPGEPY